MIAAFYDVDETILNINSMSSFFKFISMHYNTLGFVLNKKELLSYINNGGDDRVMINKLYYKCLKGYTIQHIFEAGKLWFNDCVLDKNVYNKPVIDSMINHQLQGHKVVLVSGSMRPLLEPIAELLNIDNLLCTSLCVNNQGVITGDVSGYPTVGIGKRVIIEKFANHHNIDLSKSYSYGDDVSDIQMLECVGLPICVGGQSSLVRYALKRKWSIIPT